jgi:UDP-N-acetylmuramoyl-tripeptide--D-alanyl-D-alanine ligase
MRLGLSWGELALWTGGRLARGRPEVPFDSFSIDTRGLEAGRNFWALKGERHDAHDHLADAEGAGGWIVAAGRWPSEGAPAQVLEVADTLEALQALAARHRRRFGARIAAVTGSNGKTTTKEMLRAVCAAAGPTCATRGNLNNHFGVPLSLLELGAEHRFGVFELGASHVGEIAALTRLAAPDAAVVTNVSEAHVGLFGGIEKVFEAKSELPRGISGPAALNADDARLRRLASELGSRALLFGASPDARVRIEGAALLFDGARVELEGPAATAVNRGNAAAAAAGALALGLGPEEIRRGLRSFVLPPLRMELRRSKAGAALVVDAYNANPGSMRAALSEFVAGYEGKRRTAVLGDMKELGQDSERLHRELGEWLRTLRLDRLFLAGPEMRPAAEAAAGGSYESCWSEDPLDLAEPLARGLGPDDAVFFKGSRAMALERLADKL